MKILHTSDWHLDCRLYDRRRTDEHQAFFDWLRQTIAERKIDVLIVSGDVYDNRNPTLESQEMYLRFLTQLYKDRLDGRNVCRHVIVTAGNHDSASFLEVEKPVLKYLNISVVAKEPEIIVVEGIQDNQSNDIPLVVVAIPFLSDVELRKSVEGETAKEKSLNLMKGLRDVYQSALEKAKEQKDILKDNHPFVPMVATGHLFAQGSSSLGLDGGERDIYVGTLDKFPAGDFPEEFDYIALGHLHVPQIVGGQERIQYSGSPIPVGFGEAGQTKRVVEIQWDETGERNVTDVTVPSFRTLIQITEKSKDAIRERLTQLIESSKEENKTVWLEIVYSGSEAPGLFGQQLEELVADTNVTLLAFKWQGTTQAGISRQFKGEKLRTLDPIDVFQRTLTSQHIPEEDRNMLLNLYKEILETVQ